MYKKREQQRFSFASFYSSLSVLFTIKLILMLSVLECKHFGCRVLTISGYVCSIKGNRWHFQITDALHGTIKCTAYTMEMMATRENRMKVREGESEGERKTLGGSIHEKLKNQKESEM